MSRLSVLVQRLVEHETRIERNGEIRLRKCYHCKKLGADTEVRLFQSHTRGTSTATVLPST